MLVIGLIIVIRKQYTVTHFVVALSNVTGVTLLYEQISTTEIQDSNVTASNTKNLVEGRDVHLH